MKKILLSNGKTAIVDDEDFARVNRYRWNYLKPSGSQYGYAMRIVTESKKRKAVYLHRFIMGAPDGFDCDHKNGNGLDCRKENLRICSRAQNNHNRRKQANTSSRYKGVTFDRSRGKWLAQITHHGKRYHLGVFENEIEAAIEYDLAAMKLNGDYARMNFVER